MSKIYAILNTETNQFHPFKKNGAPTLYSFVSQAQYRIDNDGRYRKHRYKTVDFSKLKVVSVKIEIDNEEV